MHDQSNRSSEPNVEISFNQRSIQVKQQLSFFSPNINKTPHIVARGFKNITTQKHQFKKLVLTTTNYSANAFTRSMILRRTFESVIFTKDRLSCSPSELDKKSTT